MDPATLTTATFTMRTKQGNNPVAATVSYNSSTKQAIFHPTSSLASLTAYRATVKGGVSGVKDLAGNPLAVDFVWNFTTGQADTTPPDTTITAGPSGTVTSTSASFSFSATEIGSTFACSLDGAAFSNCSSGISYSGLANGSHTFLVRATDAAGNVDATPDSRTWTVSAIVPDTTITSGASGSVNSSSASFSFTSTQAGSTFECSLDGAAFASCASPKAYSALANGSHTFQVRAIYTGNTDPTPASQDWIVDTIAPDTTTTSGPSGSVNSASASFSFSATEAGSTFECKLDSGSFAACTSPQSYTGLANGSHTFQVRAKDAALNVDATPASRTWTIDTVAPTGVAITAPANNANVSGQVTISATASDNVGVVRVRFFIDGVLFDTDTSAPFSTTWNSNKVTKTTHTIYVIADDAAGNTTQSATITVRVQ
jgi:hypothetical protein